MTAQAARGITPWGGAARGRVGFMLGSYGMSSWPLPRPASILFGASPSGFTLSGADITAWTDPVGSLDAPAVSTPNVAQINGVDVADMATGEYFHIGSSLFTGQSGEVWVVFQLDSLTPSLGQGPALFSSSEEPAGPQYFYFLVTPVGNLRIVGAVSAGTDQAVDGGTVLATGTTYVARFYSTGTAWGIDLNGVAETLTVVLGPNDGKWFGDFTARDQTRIGRGVDVNHKMDGRIGFLMVIEGGNLSSEGAAQWNRLLTRAFGV